MQDLPGRVGYWQVGVPPSGPFDPVSFAEANLAVGNPAGAPGLEVTAGGPDVLRFSDPVGRLRDRCSDVESRVDGVPSRCGSRSTSPPVARWRSARPTGPGLRTYLAVRGGLDVPDYLGSASTFTLGGFGGHGGRALLRR